jgi:hypothetical protein
MSAPTSGRRAFPLPFFRTLTIPRKCIKVREDLLLFFKYEVLMLYILEMNAQQSLTHRVTDQVVCAAFNDVQAHWLDHKLITERKNRCMYVARWLGQVCVSASGYVVYGVTITIGLIKIDDMWAVVDASMHYICETTHASGNIRYAFSYSEMPTLDALRTVVLDKVQATLPGQLIKVDAKPCKTSRGDQ